METKSRSILAAKECIQIDVGNVRQHRREAEFKCSTVNEINFLFSVLIERGAKRALNALAVYVFRPHNYRLRGQGEQLGGFRGWTALLRAYDGSWTELN